MTTLLTKPDRARTKELKSVLAERVAEGDRLAECWTNEEKGLVVNEEQRVEFIKVMGQCDELKGLLAAEESRFRLHDYLAAPDGTPLAGTDAAATGSGLAGLSSKSLSERFLGSDEFKAFYSDGQTRARSMAHKMDGLSIDDLGGLSLKDVHGLSAGLVAGIPGFGTAQQLSLVERQRRPTRIRDLFPVQRTNAAVLYGIRQTGWTNNAAVVPQMRAADEVSPATGGPTDRFARKPTSTVTFTTITYPIATVAHLMHVHKTVLDDEPRLRGLLDRDLIDGIKMAEDWEILYGTGIGGDITGLVNTPGVQTYTQDPAKDKKTGALRRAITRVSLAYFDATGVVLHPLDWEDIELETDDDGRYRVAVSVALGAEKRVWRLGVSETSAIQHGKFLVGSFGDGSKIYDREQVGIEVSTENKDNFERNAITLRAEERIALEVPRPEAHVYGSFAA